MQHAHASFVASFETKQVEHVHLDEADSGLLNESIASNDFGAFADGGFDDGLAVEQQAQFDLDSSF